MFSPDPVDGPVAAHVGERHAVLVEVLPGLALDLVGGEDGQHLGVQRHGVVDQLRAFGVAGQRAERDVDAVGDEVGHALGRLGRAPIRLPRRARRRCALPTSMSKPAHSPASLRTRHVGEVRVDADADLAFGEDVVERLRGRGSCSEAERRHAGERRRHECTSEHCRVSSSCCDRSRQSAGLRPPPPRRRCAQHELLCASSRCVGAREFVNDGDDPCVNSVRLRLRPRSRPRRGR